MNDKTQAAPLTPIAEYNATASALADLSQRYKNVVFEVATTAGMGLARKGRAELRLLRVDLEKKRVELKAPALERTRLIDAEAKRITAELSSLEDPIDQQIKDEEGRKEREKAEREAKEASRIAAIQMQIADINGTAARCVGMPPTSIRTAIEAVRAMSIDWADEFKDLAKAAKDHAEAALVQLHAGALAQERERAEAAEKAEAERLELARLRSEQAERERVEAERNAAQAEADRQAREKIEQEQAASREKIEAEQRAAQFARDEADKAAAEARATEAERQRAASEKLRMERDRVEAEKAEVARLQSELFDGEAMLRKFVERFGGRKDFIRISNAITKFLDERQEQKA